MAIKRLRVFNFATVTLMLRLQFYKTKTNKSNKQTKKQQKLEITLRDQNNKKKSVIKILYLDHILQYHDNTIALDLAKG